MSQRRDLHEPQTRRNHRRTPRQPLHPGIELHPEATESPRREQLTILTPSPVSTAQLSWDGRRREFTGEISATNGFGRVFSDACDEGLTLVSRTTGHQVVFVVDATHRDAEGDITHWTLSPATPAASPRTGPRPALDGITLTLFND